MTGLTALLPVLVAAGSLLSALVGVDPTLLQVDRTGETLRVLVVFATYLLGAVIGLLIAAKAWQGYRRNDSGPMLFLAAGIVLLTAVPAGLSLLLSNVGGVRESTIVLATNGSELVGLLAILYSLYGDP